MTNQIAEIVGKTVYDSEHHKVGKVEDIYEDERSHEPTWVTISLSSGLFGTKQTFVPLAITHTDHDEVIIDTTKNAIEDAPQIDAKDELTAEDERVLYKYYQAVVGEMSESPDREHIANRDMREKDAEHSDDRSADASNQEDMNQGRMKLKRYVVTENQTFTMPVTREVYRMEEEPSQGDNTKRDEPQAHHNEHHETEER